MSRKSLIMLGMVVGSTLGAYVPAIWGDSVFSFSSVFLSAVGGFGGIWLMYKVTR
ncbi:MAG: hypothetical protein ACYC8S_01735 [Minisyncoccota bacterium]